MMILVTDEWAGLGLAMQAQRQGTEVIAAYDHSALDEKDYAYSELCGSGLVEKVYLDVAMKREVGKGHLWVFDSNGLADHADQLRSRGEVVIGTSVLAQRLEDDRDYAVQMAERAGLHIPISEKFTTHEAAIKWLKKNADRAFVYKPNKGVALATYVPLNKDEPEQANFELQEYLRNLKTEGEISFILQEVKNGTEVNFDLWVRDGKPVAAFCDLEAKRKMVGDLGENIGCAGGYAFSIDQDTPGLLDTACRYLELPEIGDYTGSVDVNVMYTEDGTPWFLENCFRFGYNALPALAYGIAQWPLEEILRSWAYGGESLEAAFSKDFAASLTCIVDHPKQGTPIIARPSIADHLYFYRMYKGGDVPCITGGWEEVACVVSSGESIRDAGESCRSIIEKVSIPGLGYRTDLSSDWIPTLPIPRYFRLLGMGVLKGDYPVVSEPMEHDRASETRMRPSFRV